MGCSDEAAKGEIITIKYDTLLACYTCIVHAQNVVSANDPCVNFGPKTTPKYNLMQGRDI